MTAAETSIKDALVIDFTGRASEFKQLSGFGDELTALIREENGPEVLVLIDYAVGIKQTEPVVVRDHLNLTGTSPLLGPNDPCGERFPVVQGIYVEGLLPSLKRSVTAGLRPGTQVKDDDIKLVKELGADSCSFNVVQTMLIAAHAKRKVFAVLIPEGSNVPAELVTELKKLTGR